MSNTANMGLGQGQSQFLCSLYPSLEGHLGLVPKGKNHNSLCADGHTHTRNRMDMNCSVN